MSEDISSAAVTVWVQTFADLVELHRGRLTDLDAAIGDGDHGSNVDRGIRSAVSALGDLGPASVGLILSTVGTTLVLTVGGASGPLLGTLFLRMSTSLGSLDAAPSPRWGAALRAGLDGVEARGKAELGDKTMLDALAPAVEAFEQVVSTGRPLREALVAAHGAAASGRDATVPMVAKKGRASYLGERSAGHQDPGATTVALLMEAAVTSLA